MKYYYRKCICLVLAVILILSAAGCNDSGKKGPDAESKRIYDMRTDDLVDPVGIDNPTPIFSWKSGADTMGWRQSAYQITVKKGSDVVWDSGKVESDASIGIAYEGRQLESSTEYSWTVRVWDQSGKEEASAAATFEMGLLGDNAFSDTSWISCGGNNLYNGTKYTIDFDFIIEHDNQGFCFGMKDSGTFVMWQVNTWDGNGRVLLRPHFKSGGNWTAYPGGPGNVSAVDITDAVGYSGRDMIGKMLHERIEVDGRTIKTYFGKDENTLTLADTYTHSSDIPLAGIGFRQSTDASSSREIALFDNLVIQDADGNILYENDFSSGMTLSGASYYSIQDGMLRVGTENAGEHVYRYTEGNQLPAFRKTVDVGNDLLSAKLYTSGLGVYESYINGERVGRKMSDGSIVYHELKPGFTEMADRKFYSTYDVTWMLKEGETNVLSAVVSSSWWSDLVAARYGKEDAYLAKLILIYKNGEQQVITTDTSWKAANASAVTYADIFTGETYDARVDQGWMLPGFDDSAWDTVKINNEFKGILCAWSGSPITVREDLQRDVKSVTVYQGATGASASKHGTINVIRTYGDESFALNPGETALIDFGQNFAGWEAFTVQGNAGTNLVISHGEILNDGEGAISRGNDGPEGSIYNANYRSAEAVTRYTLKGGEAEYYHPSFTFYGFRYIEITTDQTVTFQSVDGQVVTSVEKDTGFIETSDAAVNQLISNIRWGQYSNYLSVPTDCPQRDERQGWTADTQVFSKAGSYFAFSKSFLEKFMMDVRDSQREDGAYPGTAPTGEYGGGDWGGFGWADAGIIVPYNLYMQYGDTSVIKENWESMQLYIDGFLAGTNKYGGRPVWGDWLAYESNDDTIKSMLGIAFYAWDALMMAEMAGAIGLPDEAARYTAVYETEKEFFQKLYVKKNGELKRSEQSVCLYALYLDLLPDEDSVEAVTKQLIENIERNGNKLQTGFLGTAIILPTLTKIGRSDMAYTLLLQHDNPSWLYSVDQGATTVWERWNSYTLADGFGDVGMNSFNHYAYGVVASWMFESMAGINYDKNAPGYKKVQLAPQPDSRISVKASYDSAYGIITAESSFEGNMWTYKCSLPANTDGVIHIPAAREDACRVNGKSVTELSAGTDGIEFAGFENGVLLFNAAAGSFEFHTQLAG